jgi:CubicO group peptidase (beta-lactamase class C family)
VVDADDVDIDVSDPRYRDAFFEFGSIAKTMTATLLALLAGEGVVALDDAVTKWLDAGDNSDITLRQLATHTSGLARVAPNAFTHEGFDQGDPYACYTESLAEEGLRASTRESVGTESYSNFGYQLLGLALSRAGGEEFSDLLRTRLFDPLGMSTARPADAGYLKPKGYQRDEAVPPWHCVLCGPGGLDATIADMTAYLSAVLSPPDGPLGVAMRLAMDEPLGWVKSGESVVWHNGGTAGFHSMLVANRAAGRGAVAMANNGALDELDFAVRLAADGDDPRGARPEPAGHECDDVAEALGRLALAEEWDALRARMTAAVREAVSADALRSMWSSLLEQAGEVQSTAIGAATRVTGATRVPFELHFAAGSVALVFTINDAGQVAGLLLR